MGVFWEAMKWPTELLLIRHAESAYNDLKKKKESDPDYRRFRKLFEGDRSHSELPKLAELLQRRHALGCICARSRRSDFSKRNGLNLQAPVSTGRSESGKRIMGSPCSITIGESIMCFSMNREGCTICWATMTIAF